MAGAPIYGIVLGAVVAFAAFPEAENIDPGAAAAWRSESAFAVDRIGGAAQLLSLIWLTFLAAIR
jgi:hypothetical protein